MRRFKDSFLKDKKYWKEILIILLVGIIINACCFLMPLVVHAESESSIGSMPYNCIDFQDYQSCLSDEDCQAIINYISTQKANNSAIANLIPNWDGTDVVMEINDANNTWVWVTIIYKPYVNESFTFNENYNFTENSFNLYVTDRILTVVYNPLTGSFGGLQQPSGNSISIGGSSSSVSSYFGNYLPRYPFFYNGDPILNSQAKEVFISRVNGGISVGDFTDLPGLDEILNNIQNSWEPPSTITGHALPNQPTENPNNNDFQNRLQMFDYLKDSINSIVGNLGYNLKKWIDNLTGKMIEGFNSVSQNIWNGFKTLMDNIKDFFGAKIDAIIDKFEYITEPLDQEEINDFIESSDVYGDISSIQTSVTSFTSSLTGVSEPSSYSITLHIEDIGILHQEEPYVLSFDILNDVKVYIRGFLWCFCTYGLFISVADSLANYINGGGGEDD